MSSAIRADLATPKLVETINNYRTQWALWVNDPKRSSEDLDNLGLSIAKYEEEYFNRTGKWLYERIH